MLRASAGPRIPVTGSGDVNAATIATFEKDKPRMVRIQEQYLHDAEEFLLQMQRDDDKQAEDTESGAEDGDGGAESSAAAPRKKLHRGSVWKWLLATEHMQWAVLGVGWHAFMIPQEITL